VLGVAAGALLLPALLRETLPRLDSLFLSPRMAALDAALDVCADRPVVSMGYQELSLAYLTGTDTVFGGARVAEILASGEPGWRVFAPLSDEESLEALAGVELTPIATVTGVNYNAGPETLEFGLFTRADDQSLSACLSE
jgi:hypothetical protein